MHINRSGFNLERGSGGISGCIDPHTFYNPVWQAEGKSEAEGLGETMENVVAKQYLEVGCAVMTYLVCWVSTSHG